MAHAIIAPNAQKAVSLNPQIEADVQTFQKACEIVSKGKYTVATANAESEKLESAFRSVADSITSLQQTLTLNGGIKHGEEDHFFTLTEMESTVRASLAGTFTELGKIDPAISAKTVEILSGRKVETTQVVYVYYEGKGDLFIRGENGKVRLPGKMLQALSKQVDFGGTEDLHWGRGLPMTLVADHLWRVQIIAKEGPAAKYKFLVSDCLWQEGGDYLLSKSISDFHMPSFDPQTSAVLIPMDVGFGNRLAIFGKGTVQIHGKDVVLSWEKGTDMECFGHNLWTLPLAAKEEIKFKICVINKDGVVIWEEGPDRKLKGGQEVIAVPKFPQAQFRPVSIETASQALGPQLFAKQEEIRERERVEQLRQKGQLVSRPLPPNQTGGKTFKDEDIVRINDVLRVDEVDLPMDKFFSEKFFFSYTSTGKAVIIQEAPKGCTAGVSGMLILDNGKLPDGKTLKNRTAASWKRIEQDINNAGLVALTTPVANFHRNLRQLKQQIDAHGPAYVRIKEGNGNEGHAIIVNAISSDPFQVEIRDPWHSWEGIVKGEAFRAAWVRSLDQCETTDRIVQVRDGVK